MKTHTGTIPIMFWSGQQYQFPTEINTNDSLDYSTTVGVVLTSNVSEWSTSIPTEEPIGLQNFFLRITGAIVCGVVIICTLIGNVLVVLAVFTFKRLRNVTNILMASLAVADITVAVLVMPYLLVYDYMGWWCFGAIFCHIWISFDVMCCTASILHLCIIALDRYWAITNPLRYKTVMSKRRAYVLIASAWMASASISFIPIMLGWYAEHKVSLFVEITDCGLQVNPIYAIVSSLTSFYLPSPIMFYIYFRIFLIAERQSREIKRLEMSMQHASKQEQRRLKKRSKRLLSDTKAIKTLGLIMGIFCFCWLPFFLMYVILPFCSSCHLPNEAKSAITWLGYVNSSINPCIYGFFNADFRAAFRRTLHCDFHRRPLRHAMDCDDSHFNKSMRSMDSLELDSISTIKSSHTF